MNILFVNVLVGMLIMIILLGITAGLVLPACSIKSFFGVEIGDCSNSRANQSVELFSTALAERSRLIDRIGRLESQLQGQKCESTADQTVDSKIDLEAWNEGDITEFEGCWELGRDKLVITDSLGKVLKNVSKFTLCLDQNGIGEGKSYATDGVVCKVPVSGIFESDELVITEQGNSICDDNTFINPDIYNCRLDQHQYAQCRVSSRDFDSTREDFEIELRRLRE